MYVTNQVHRSPQQLRLPMNYRTGRRKAGVKIKISKLRRDFPDQLAPFNGLWGYYDDLDRYNGTIFRFALRKEGSQSELLETMINPFFTAKSTFQDVFETARLSLLFLRRIRKIDFRIRRKSLEWEVRMEKADNITFSDCLLIRLTKAPPIDSVLSWTDKWWRLIEDLRDAPDVLQYRHKRTMKHIECGIAALKSPEPSETGGLYPKEVSPRFFNCLPLRFPSRLPVHVHATFLLSGDRQSISIEETARDSGSDWNKWILESAIPQLYLSFLEDVGRKIGAKVFSFFPTQISTGNNLSDLVRSSFWSLVPTSHHRLYPVVEKNSAKHAVGITPEGHGQRRAPQLVEFQEATFNLLDTSLSKDLIAVLPFLFENLVQPTNSLRSGMSRLPQIRVVNASLIRRALQSEKAAGHLMDSMKRERRLLKSLLHYVTPITDADLDELKNSRILPVVNGSLGRLVSRSQSSQSTYFFVDVVERELCSFGAGVLISDEIDTEFMNKIKCSDRFNVDTLKEDHIGKLLEMKTDWPAAPDDGHKEWLVQFWKYMNERYPDATASEPSKITNTYLNVQLQRFPLHEARCGTKSRYTSFEDFEGLPAVIESASADERTLCLGLPGLYLIDRKTVPTGLLLKEQRLSRPASLCRFLKAISLLASRQKKALNDYVRVSLHGQNLEVN